MRNERTDWIISWNGIIIIVGIRIRIIMITYDLKGHYMIFIMRKWRRKKMNHWEGEEADKKLEYYERWKKKKRLNKKFSLFSDDVIRIFVLPLFLSLLFFSSCSLSLVTIQWVNELLIDGQFYLGTIHL